MFLGLLDHDADVMRCASAGQYPYPVMIEGCELRALSTRSRPIGLFDDVRYHQAENHGFYEVDSVEAAWNTGSDEGPNLGHKNRYKEGR